MKLTTTGTKARAHYDAIIIGAGAAGLAAASELAAQQLSVCVLEARDRLGGRIHTLRVPDVPVPVELGAEFIHGLSKPIFEWMRRANEPIVDATQTRWTSVRGKLEASDTSFEQMKRGLARVRRPTKDIPFAQFLETHAKGTLSPRVREFARMLVEGYDAADSTRVSTFEILDEWSDSGAAADAPTFRPVRGYAALVEGLTSSLQGRAHLQLNSAVKEIHWERGAVRVIGTRLGERFELEAPRAIVTLPVGVLKAPAEMPNGILISPTLRTKQRALETLALGPAIKVTLRFHKPFWEELDQGRYRNAAFFHAPRQPFPTFWTSLPMRTTLMVAWCGGPNASRLAGTPDGEIVQIALKSLQSVFGARTNVVEHFSGAHLHDWQADPYSGGAYSYVLAGGEGSRHELAKPVQDTLYFAGEAVDLEGEAATVGGALASGRRAALELLRAVERSSRRKRARRT